ncbi:rhamnan synthesis F family protein [Lactococcus lactis]
MHAFYLDLIPEYLNYFDKYIQNYDLYITTDTEEKYEEILKNYPLPQIKKVIVTGNKGRAFFRGCKFQN